jgi:hypothetical protein
MPERDDPLPPPQSEQEVSRRLYGRSKLVKVRRREPGEAADREGGEPEPSELPGVPWRRAPQ